MPRTALEKSCHSFIFVVDHGYRVQCSLLFNPELEQKRLIYNFKRKKWTMFWSELFLNIWSATFKCFREEKSWSSTKRNLHLEWKAAKANNREVWSQMETRDYYLKKWLQIPWKVRKGFWEEKPSFCRKKWIQVNVMRK